MSDTLPSNAARTVLAITLLAALAVLSMGVVTAVASSSGDASSVDSPTVETATTSPELNVSESAYEEPAPEPGDEYYEATASDGSWISYINPRDEYRSPYLGDGSGKICVTLLNEAGEPVVGESVPNTTVTVPTGEELEWHTSADPMAVDYPLTDHYDRPLDADQFGTDPNIPQGDGYMDSHCIEMHGQPEDGTIEYGEAQIEGEHADDIEVVGYVQQANTPGWDTSVDPIEDAESYEEVGGSWTFTPDASHGQVVVVLQLDVAEGYVEADDGSNGNETNDENGTDDGNENETDTADGTDDGTEPADDENATADDESADAADDSEEMPGFGMLATIAALSALALARYRR